MPRRDHFPASLGLPRHRNRRVTASDRDPHTPTPKRRRDPSTWSRGTQSAQTLPHCVHPGTPAIPRRNRPPQTKDSSSGCHGIFDHTFSSAARTPRAHTRPNVAPTRARPRKTRQTRPRLKLCNQSFRATRVAQSNTAKTMPAKMQNGTSSREPPSRINPGRSYSVRRTDSSRYWSDRSPRR